MEVTQHGGPSPVDTEGRGYNPALAAGYADPPPRMGFFTDTSLCIGCKACQVACKEWNEVPGGELDLTATSLDNTGALGADTWRHVAFIEQDKQWGDRKANLMHEGLDESGDFRWLMSSDVCKHCTHAACLDVCPTGALFRTEFGTVVVQDEVCNGCGYCVPACPYGVIDVRDDGPEPDGGAHKCTLCYDRLADDLEPACAKACPTDSIQFGELDDLREHASHRVIELQAAGVTDARLYGENPDDGVGGDGAFFLLLDEPEVYGLPPDPKVTTRDLGTMWKSAGIAAVGLVAAVAAATFGGS